MIAMFLLSVFVSQLSNLVLRTGLVRPSLTFTGAGAKKYFYCIFSNVGSPVFILLYVLGGGGFATEDFYCSDFTDNTKLDMYVLFAVQWVNGKNILDTFAKPTPSPKILAHHILILIVTFSGICSCRKGAGVQASDIAILEFGSIFYCIYVYWPTTNLCRLYYWFMSISDYIFLILMASQQVLPCASTSNWPRHHWIFNLISGIILAFLRQHAAVTSMHSHGIPTIEKRLLPFLFRENDIALRVDKKKG
jgi:hypothetical protein